jgi:glycerate 2-kinase
VTSVRAIPQLRQHIRAAYHAGVSSVAAGPATARGIADVASLLDCDGRVLVIAAGKAARPMAAACAGLGRGFVLSPEPESERASLDPALASYESFQGGHPIPTLAGFAASRRILDAAATLGEGDRLLLLLSGGASSLFEVPAPALVPSDALAVYEALLRSGLPIDQMNLLRSALSMVKGGRLAAVARPAPTVTLAISDVVGDDPAVIGSGPTVAAQGSVGEAKRLLDALELDEQLRERVGAALGPAVEDVPSGHYRIVAAATDAAQAARHKLHECGYGSVVSPVDPLVGDAEAVAGEIAGVIRARVREPGRWGLVMAGETTVRLPADAGVGGRNRHLACLVAKLLDGVPGFAFLAAGTDGIDGSATGAGGVVDGESAARMRVAGIDLLGALRGFDSGTALAAVGDDIVTGASSTNVGDLVVAAGG